MDGGCHPSVWGVMWRSQHLETGSGNPVKWSASSSWSITSERLNDDRDDGLLNLPARCLNRICFQPRSIGLFYLDVTQITLVLSLEYFLNTPEPFFSSHCERRLGDLFFRWNCMPDSKFFHNSWHIHLVRSPLKVFAKGRCLRDALMKNILKRTNQNC